MIDANLSKRKEALCILVECCSDEQRLDAAMGVLVGPQQKTTQKIISKSTLAIQCGLSARAQNVLEKKGCAIGSGESLRFDPGKVAQISEREWQLEWNCGSGTVDEIRAWLQKFDLALQRD